MTANFYVLPVVTCPIVLGVQWLATIGPIETNYSNLMMKFQQRVSCLFQGLRYMGIEALTEKDCEGVHDTRFFLHVISTNNQLSFVTYPLELV